MHIEVDLPLKTPEALFFGEDEEALDSEIQTSRIQGGIGLKNRCTIDRKTSAPLPCLKHRTLAASQVGLLALYILYKNYGEIFYLVTQDK